MVELVNIYNLEQILKAIAIDEFRTSADINKLRNLKSIVYKTEMVPQELVSEYELAEYEYNNRISTKRYPSRGSQPMLQLIPC